MMESRPSIAGQLRFARSRCRSTDLGVNVLERRHERRSRLDQSRPYRAIRPSMESCRAVACANSSRNQLNGLHVDFGSITGNVISRRLTFDDQVQHAYAPVDNWDAVLTTDNPDQLGPRASSPVADKLTVVPAAAPAGRSAGRSNFCVTKATRWSTSRYGPRPPHHLQSGQGFADSPRRRP